MKKNCFYLLIPLFIISAGSVFAEEAKDFKWQVFTADNVYENFGIDSISGELLYISNERYGAVVDISEIEEMYYDAVNKFGNLITGALVGILTGAIVGNIIGNIIDHQKGDGVNVYSISGAATSTGALFGGIIGGYVFAGFKSDKRYNMIDLNLEEKIKLIENEILKNKHQKKMTN